MFGFIKVLIKISSQVAANVNDAKKPAMYVECLAHAREWITGSVCLGSIDIVSIGHNQESRLVKLGGI